MAEPESAHAHMGSTEVYAEVHTSAHGSARGIILAAGRATNKMEPAVRTHHDPSIWFGENSMLCSQLASILQIDSHNIERRAHVTRPVGGWVGALKNELDKKSGRARVDERPNTTRDNGRRERRCAFGTRFTVRFL